MTISLIEPENGCPICKMANVPPPGGDIGFLFLAGFVTREALASPARRANFISSFCPRHKSAKETLEMVDSGMLQFLGFKL